MIPKLRAWDKENKTMHEVIAIDYEGQNIALSSSQIHIYFDSHGREYDHAVYPAMAEGIKIALNWEPMTLFIVMQATGLKDKNGIEIFEGDIIKCPAVEKEAIGQVVKSQFYIPGFDVKCKSGASAGLTNYGREFEPTIIGNIYENPTLFDSVEPHDFISALERPLVEEHGRKNAHDEEHRLLALKVIELEKRVMMLENPTIVHI